MKKMASAPISVYAIIERLVSELAVIMWLCVSSYSPAHWKYIPKNRLMSMPMPVASPSTPSIRFMLFVSRTKRNADAK